MSETERSLYLENPKRPYSWTGDLDSPPSPKPVRNGSLRLTKSAHETIRSTRSNKENGKDSRRFKDGVPRSGSKRGQFNLPKSGSGLLVEKLPTYLNKDETCNEENNDTSSQITLPKFLNSVDSVEPKQKQKEKKRSKFGNLRRKTPPTMTSHVSDFEYFSLSDPPPGLARPVQIFPQCSKQIRRVDKHKFTENSKRGSCQDCMTRIPYGTVIATFMCIIGVGVFCATMYRGTTLTLLMFDEVFRIKITWDREYRVEPVQLTFMIVGAAMGGLALMILFLGCLSTGSTRAKVYKTWRGRVGGRVSCAIFMGITYLLSIIWLLMLLFLVVVTVFYTLAWFQCRTIPENQCIDYNQFAFLFPSSTTEEDRRVCPEEKKTFCKDCVNNAEVMFIFATTAACLVIISLIHYLMCLSANYAHIKDQEKFIDLQEIKYLQESEMSTLPKDRF